jgi:endonuclease III
MAKASHPTGTLSTDLLTVCEALEARYGRRKAQKPTDFIEALVFQILELGVGERQSRDALKRLRDEFVDWNDMRVASIREIEDILGARYHKVREKAEDLKSLLADLWTAFRRMDLGAVLEPQGLETLRALPDTTNIRRDSVERAIAQMMDVRLFPTDEDQFRLIKLLGGVPKHASNEQWQKKIEEALELEDLLRLHRVAREHVVLCQEAGEDEPQPISYGWDQPDPLGMGKPAKPAKADKPATGKVEKPAAKAEKPAAAKVEKPAAKPEPKPKAEKPAPAVKAEKPAPAAKADKPAAAKAEKSDKPAPAKAAKPEKAPAAKKPEPAKKPAKADDKPAPAKKPTKK